MFYSERQQELIDILREKNRVTVHELSTMLFASEATIRRDLSVLEKEGKVKRTFGGAVLSEKEFHEVSLLLRSTQNIDAKKNIAKKAEKFLADGQVIFLDSSSSAAYMVPLLEGYRDLTVITNSPKTSIALAERNICNYSTGGLQSNRSVSFVGGDAADFIDRFYADVLFFSCRGYDDNETLLSESSDEEAYIKKKMIKNSKKCVFLCDKSKFGKRYAHTVCKLCDIDEMICED